MFVSLGPQLPPCDAASPSCTCPTPCRAHTGTGSTTEETLHSFTACGGFTFTFTFILERFVNWNDFYHKKIHLQQNKHLQTIFFLLCSFCLSNPKLFNVIIDKNGNCVCLCFVLFLVIDVFFQFQILPMLK